MNPATIAGKKIIYSGGGYFRLFPYSIISRLMKKSDYVMTYFHPRDFDPGQPMIDSLPLKRKFMSYTGLKHAGIKFEKLLGEFAFTNVENAALLYEWNKAQIVELG